MKTFDWCHACTALHAGAEGRRGTNCDWLMPLPQSKSCSTSCADMLRVYLRGAPTTGKSVFFLIPLVSVRQRWRGSCAGMLDVSGREECDRNWVMGGADGAAHQRRRRAERRRRSADECVKSQLSSTAFPCD